MSAEFSKLCQRLAIASTVAVLMPMGVALILSGTSAIADSGPAAERPQAHAPTPLSTLGRANAVAWISPGHLSAP